MKATAQMGGLTRQEIEYLTAQFALLAARAEWKPKSIDRIRAFGDLALRAIERWVPVSERLPEMGVDVLIYHVLGDRDRDEVPHAYDVGWLLEDGWYFPWDRGRDRQRPQFVTHWMKLPERP